MGSQSSSDNGGCRHIPPSVYCHGEEKQKIRRSRRRNRKRKFQRRRSSKRSMKCRPGIKTKNPFFNYLRVFRRKHCGWPQTKIAMEGAKCWCKLTDEQRQKFYKQACSMRKKLKKGKRGRSRRRHRMRKLKKMH